MMCHAFGSWGGFEDEYRDGVPDVDVVLMEEEEEVSSEFRRKVLEREES